MRRALPAIVLALASCIPQPVTAPPGAPAARVDIARVLAAPPFASMLAQSDADLAVLQRATTNAAFQNPHASITASAADIHRRLNAGAQQLLAMYADSLDPSGDAREQRDFGGAAETFARAAQARVERAAELRAAQMREHEATVAYDFERAHAGQQLVLRLKLHDLHLDAATRQRYRQQLDALDRQEAVLVAAAQATDDAALASYRTQLAAQLRANATSATAGVNSGEREAQRLAQSSAQTTAWPRWPAIDLAQHLLALRSADDANRVSVRNEIAALRRDRDALRAEIVASAEARAAQIATSQHLGRVYAGVAPAGARDITDAVIRSYCVSTGSSDDGRCMK